MRVLEPAAYPQFFPEHTTGASSTGTVSTMLHQLMKKLHAPIYESRLRALVDAVVPHLRAGDRALDVGCGFGQLGRALLDSPKCPADVHIRGLERAARGDEMIEMDVYAGGTMPYDDRSFDVVIVADVLHHEHDPNALLCECVRVTQRLVIIKDHQRRGLFAQQRIALIDWAANAPYGVPCLYRYNTLQQWRDSHQQHNLTLIDERTAMNLYPPIVNMLFGRSLQYLAVLQRPDAETID